MGTATKSRERVGTMSTELCIVRGIVFKEGDYWASMILNFDIVTAGDSPREALDAALAVATARVREGLAAGKSWEELQRPAPRRYWLRFFWESWKHTVRRRLRDGYQTFETSLPLGC
jgi:hypothetical protein